MQNAKSVSLFLEKYAPKMMDEAEIRSVIEALLAEMGLDAPDG